MAWPCPNCTDAMHAQFAQVRELRDLVERAAPFVRFGLNCQDHPALDKDGARKWLIDAGRGDV